MNSQRRIQLIPKRKNTQGMNANYAKVKRQIKSNILFSLLK